MTPEQIEALAVMIANNLPALLRRRPYKGSKKPNKLRNPENVYVELDDVRLIIRAALKKAEAPASRPDPAGVSPDNARRHS